MSNYDEEFKSHLESKHYFFVKSLSDGYYGLSEVWKVNNPGNALDHKIFAIKMMKPHIGIDTEENEANIINYINSRLDECGRNKNFILKYEVENFNTRKYFRSELMSDDLYNYYNISKDSSKDIDTLLSIICQLIHALHCLHNIGIVHGDLKQENIFIDNETKKIKLADFGGSAIIGHDVENIFDISGIPSNLKIVRSTTPKILPRYIKTMDDITHKDDVYSLGILIFLILTQTNRRYMVDEFHKIFNVTTSTFYKSDNSIWFAHIDDIIRDNSIFSKKVQPDEIKQTIRTLLKTMLDINIEKRPSINKIYNTERIKDLCDSRLSVYLHESIDSPICAISSMCAVSSKYMVKPRLKRAKTVSKYYYMKYMKYKMKYISLMNKMKNT